MAIINKTGNYIRADLDNCYANRFGFFVSYKIQQNIEERKIEKEKEFKVKELGIKIENLYYFYLDEINDYAKENSIKLPEEFEKLTKDLLKKLKVIQTIWNDLNLVERAIYKNYEQEMPVNLDLLYELGLDKDWFETGIIRPVECTQSVSPYNRQRFDYETAYKEIKKLFKDGFKDC